MAPFVVFKSHNGVTSNPDFICGYSVAHLRVTHHQLSQYNKYISDYTIYFFGVIQFNSANMLICNWILIFCITEINQTLCSNTVT